MWLNDPVLKTALAILVVLMGAVFFWQPLKMTMSGASINNDFVLQTEAGPLDTKALRGNVLAIVFGHADCDSACTERLGRTAKGYEALAAAERKQVKMVLVSVDPEHDTPARIGDYAKKIHPEMIGGTGTPEQVKAITEAFAAEPKKVPRPEGGEILQASTLTCIVAPDGRFVSVLNADLPAEQIAASLRARLPATLPPAN